MVATSGYLPTLDKFFPALGLSSPPVFASPHKRPAPPLAAVSERMGLGEAPISFTISGGVSLGTYQAGYIYYITELFKRNQINSQLKEITGASAGAINAMLSLMSVCSSQHRNPTDSLFWKIWTPLGFKELLGTPSLGSPSAVFTSEAMEAATLIFEKKWMEGLDRPCDIVLGITTTLLKPEQVTVGEGIQAKHQEEAFVLRIRNPEPGVAPLVSNYVDPTDRLPHALLYLPKDRQGQFEALRNLFLASAAFPGAFPPRAIRFCRTRVASPGNADKNGRDHSAECRMEDSKEELFIDGGVFDNEPIRLAIRTAARGLEKSPDGSYQWRPTPNLVRQYPPKEVEFRVLDVDSKRYPAEPPQLQDETLKNPDPILTYLKKVAIRFVTTARSQQLFSVLEENPDIPNAIVSTRNYYPLISEPALAFFGFFDRGFRQFDFYMGMYDARKNLSEDFQKRFFKKHLTLQFPEDVDEAGWGPLRCLRHLLDHEEKYQDSCEEDNALQTKILLQLSMNRLYSSCGELKNTDLAKDFSAECQSAAQGNPPPAISPTSFTADSTLKTDEWRREIGEDEGYYSLRTLYQNNYSFELLEGKNDEPKAVLGELRKQTFTAFKNVTGRQPPDGRFILGVLGEPAFNLIHYQPPPKEIHFLLGEIFELGGSLKLSNFMRAHAAFTFQRPQDVFASNYGSFTMTPLIGLEYEPKQINSAWVQLRLGGRVGYQLTPIDSWGNNACSDTSKASDCTRWAIEPYIAVSIYERLRIQFIQRFLPATREIGVDWNSFIQFGFELSP